ncbi:MAG: M20/M25/M40 family metallo-hydrolase, partial [Planctomycetota bacterium]|nr:M20/M25/M40 family metallo-hydrolase [Planctomycetota bacterium]
MTPRRVADRTRIAAAAVCLALLATFGCPAPPEDGDPTDAAAPESSAGTGNAGGAGAAGDATTDPTAAGSVARADDGAASMPAWPSDTARARTREFFEKVSADEIRLTIDDLAGFGTRHTLSDTTSDERGIGAARRYLLERFESIAAASGRTGDLMPKAYLDRHIQPADGRRVPEDTDIVNVALELPGTDPEARKRRYYVIGHYDSRASDPMDATIDAPGANDDASGTAIAVELARVLAAERFESTLVFMPTAGEEQGLYGADLHAKAAKAAGLDVRAVLSNDIVGDPTSPLGGRHDDAVRVFSEPFPASPDEETVRTLRRLSGTSDSPSRQLARYVEELGRLYELPTRAMLIFRTDRFLRGGDHTAFNRQGFHAVRFTEVSENYDRQHQDVRLEDDVQFGDLPQNVDATYVANVARLNLAALTHLAEAPSAPNDVRIVTAQLAIDTTLRWTR